MPSFTYNASALGLGAVFTKGGVTTIIPSQASVALAPTGGMGSSEVRNFSEAGVSFGYARTDVYGVENDTHYTTVTNVVVTNLNVFGRLAADVIEASVVSQREKEKEEPDETEFTFNAKFLGLRFDDETIAPRLDLAFLNDHPQYATIAKKLVDNYGLVRERFGFIPPTSTQLATAVAANKPIRCSMLDGANRVSRSGSVSHPDFMIDIENFGKLHLAEVLLKPGRRRVSLLRLDFKRGMEPAREGGDDPEEGSMTVASVEGNGVPSWP